MVLAFFENRAVLAFFAKGAVLVCVRADIGAHLGGERDTIKAHVHRPRKEVC